jgi:hypothetical protein
VRLFIVLQSYKSYNRNTYPHYYASYASSSYNRNTYLDYYASYASSSYNRSTYLHYHAIAESFSPRSYPSSIGRYLRWYDLLFSPLRYQKNFQQGY